MPDLNSLSISGHWPDKKKYYSKHQVSSSHLNIKKSISFTAITGIICNVAMQALIRMFYHHYTDEKVGPNLTN